MSFWAKAAEIELEAGRRSGAAIAERLLRRARKVAAYAPVGALGRALLVAGLLAGALALTPRFGAPVRLAEKSAKPQRAPAAHLAALGRQNDGLALDSDFSLDQASETWRRLHGDADEAGRMRFGHLRVSQAIAEHVVKAAQSTGSDPALLMAIAEKESMFSPSAKASTSSASGLFQFIETTWLQALRTFGWRHGYEEAAKAIADDGDGLSVAPDKRDEILKLRNDPYLSAVLAAEMLKRDGARIAERLGRPLTEGETYLIHFLGAEDAARFMTKMEAEPEASAAQLLPKPARANVPIFYERQGAKLKDRSISEVHKVFEAMMHTRSERYQGVEARLPKGVTAYVE